MLEEEVMNLDLIFMVLCLAAAVREEIKEAYAHIGAAGAQMIDSDDQIIAGHIQDAKPHLEIAFRAPLDRTDSGEGADAFDPE